jgi:hypothetical protein
MSQKNWVALVSIKILQWSVKFGGLGFSMWPPFLAECAKIWPKKMPPPRHAALVSCGETFQRRRSSYSVKANEVHQLIAETFREVDKVCGLFMHSLF